MLECMIYSNSFLHDILQKFLYAAVQHTIEEEEKSDLIF